jgi:hypothetical protein
MTIPRRAASPAGAAPSALRASPRARDHGAATAVALLAVGVAIALLAPGRGDGLPEDAAAEGMAVAARCDADLERDGRARWAACIERQRAGLAADPVAAAGLHFHAWRIADRAAAAGAPDALPLRDAHRGPLAAALRDNLVSLHRLCSAAGEDCVAIAERLSPAGTGPRG